MITKPVLFLCAFLLISISGCNYRAPEYKSDYIPSAQYIPESMEVNVRVIDNTSDHISFLPLKIRVSMTLDETQRQYCLSAYSDWHNPSALCGSNYSVEGFVGDDGRRWNPQMNFPYVPNGTVVFTRVSDGLVLYKFEQDLSNRLDVVYVDLFSNNPCYCHFESNVGGKKIIVDVPLNDSKCNIPLKELLPAGIEPSDSDMISYRAYCGGVGI